MENALLDCCSLLGIGLWMKKRIRWWKIILGTGIGVSGGVLALLYVHSFFIYLMVIVLLVNPLMLQMAYGPMNFSNFWRMYVLCVFLNLFLGGGMSFLRQNVSPDIRGWLLPIACILLFPAIFVVQTMQGKKEDTVEFSCLVGGKVIRGIALRDTGNVLMDPVLLLPVCVVSEEIRKSLFLGEEELQKIKMQTIDGDGEIDIYPVTQFFVMEHGEMVEQRQMMLGFGAKELFQGKKYQMILHKDFC